MAATRKPAVDPEIIIWDGANDEELLQLAQRVADLGVWPPAYGTLNAHVREPDGVHPGLNIENDQGQVIARIEDGNALVFDVFAPTPLFAATLEDVVAFYEVD